MLRTLTALAAVSVALVLSAGASAATSPTAPDLHPLVSPRAAGWTTVSWTPSIFPAGATGRWYELAIDSFWGRDESLSDHRYYAMAASVTSRTIYTQPGRRYWVRIRAVAAFGVWQLLSGVDEIGFRTDWRPVADPPPYPPIECC